MNNERYVRRPEFDLRIGRGDDYAGDAWEDTQASVDGGSWAAKKIVYTVVGYEPNRADYADKK